MGTLFRVPNECQFTSAVCIFSYTLLFVGF